MTTNQKPYTIGIFTFTTAMLWFSLYAYIAELSTYATTLNASYRMIGFITGSYGLTQLILRIPLGIFSDYIGKRKLFIIIGMAISVISSLLTFIAPSQWSLLITRSLAGVTASVWVVVTVLFSSYFRKDEATKSVGIMNSYNAIGQLVGMSLGGAVSYFMGTRYLYLLAAIGAFIGLISSCFIVEPKIEVLKRHFSDYLQIAKDRKLQIVSVLGILSQFLTFATAFGFVPILAKKLGAGSLELSLLTLLAIIPAIFISRLASSFIPNQIGKKNTINIGFALSSLLCIVMPFITSLPVLYVVQFFSGIGRSMVFPLLMGLGIQHISEGKRATAMGMFQASYGIGMVLGPILLGFIAQSYGLITGFIVTGIIGLIGIAITLKYIK